MPPPLPLLCGPPPFQDPLRFDDLLRGRLCPHSRLSLVLEKHPPPPEALREPRSKSPLPKCLVFCSQNRADTLEDPKPKAFPEMPLSHSDQRGAIPPPGLVKMARVLVHPRT